MLQLAVTGNEDQWRAVASRLRGGTVVGGFDARDTLPPPACDAILFLEAPRSAIPLIQSCLTEGRHVLVTAATWLSCDVLESLSTSADHSGAKFAIVNPDHFRPSRQLIRQQLEAGKLGLPGLVRMHRWEAAPASWRAFEKLPSPLAWDLDLALSLFSRPPTLVYASEASRLDRQSNPGRTIQVHLGFSEGGMALIDYSSALPGGADYQSLSVIGSAGAAYADDHQNMQLLYQGDHPRAVRADEGVRQLVNLTQDFLDALHDGRDLAPTVTNWRSVMTVVSAVEQSLTTRQAVSMEGR